MKTPCSIFLIICVVTTFGNPDPIGRHGCIPLGETCESDGSLGSCCSTFCYQLPNQFGICHDSPTQECIPDRANCSIPSKPPMCCSGLCMGPAFSYTCQETYHSINDSNGSGQHKENKAFSGNIKYFKKNTTVFLILVCIAQGIETVYLE